MSAMTGEAAFEVPHERRPLVERALIGVEILLLYCRVRWLLRRAGLEETLRVLRDPDVRPSGLEPVDEARLGLRLGGAVMRVVDRLPVDSRCLTHALVLVALLHRRGVAATVVIGVRPGDDFGAHAWVEHGGHALLQRRQNDFSPLVRL